MDLVEEIETDFGLNGFQVSTGPKKKGNKDIDGVKHCLLC